MPSKRNYGISQTNGDWILIIDADERVSKSLKDKILKILKNPRADIYSVLIINYFLGKKMSYGGWQNNYSARIFKKKFRYGKQQVHETLDCDKECVIQELKAPIYHFSHRSIKSKLKKTLMYSQWQAHYHYVRHSPPVTKKRILWLTFKTFWQRYVVEKGYKDGMEGLIEAMYQGFAYTFIPHAMLWEKQREKSAEELYQKLDQILVSNNFLMPEDE